MSDDDRVMLDAEEAMSRLYVRDDGEGGQAVHTMLNPAVNVLVGADWDIEQARYVIETHGASEAGPAAAAMGHAVAVVPPDGRPVFFETRAPGSLAAAANADEEEGESDG